MTEFTSYKPGTFNWIDLATSDAAGAKKFYGDLFGWQFIDMPAGPDRVYTMCQLNGKNVAGLYQMNPDQQAQGMPPAWSSYVSVEDADTVAEKAASLGGVVMVEPFDVMESGRMAVIQDPGGATFSLWQPKEHIGAQICNEPGTLSWNELATHDADKMGDFYSKLFGWDVQSEEIPHMVYTSFVNQGRMNGGVLQMTEEWGDMPSHWMVYFAVEDCDASVKQAEALGAKIGVPPQDIPEVGRFAMLVDPQGAALTIIKLNNPE